MCCLGELFADACVMMSSCHSQVECDHCVTVQDVCQDNVVESACDLANDNVIKAVGDLGTEEECRELCNKLPRCR